MIWAFGIPGEAPDNNKLSWRCFVASGTVDDLSIEGADDDSVDKLAQ